MEGRALARIVRATVVAVMALGVCTPAAAEPGAVRNVLGLYWSSEDFPSNAIIDNAIRSILLGRSDVAIDYYSEYLESDVFPVDEASAALATYIRQKYRDRPIDVVIAISEAAQRFVLQHRDELFPNVPVVFTGLRRAVATTDAERRMLTGVLTASAYSDTLDLVLRIHPETRRVFVIARAPTDDFVDEVRAELAPYASRVALEYITDAAVPQLIDTVRNVPAGSVVFYVRYSRDVPGHVLRPHEIASMVAEASPAPVYAIQDTYVGTGVVGGAMRNARPLAARAADITLQILGGKHPSEIPIERTLVIPTFDWRQLKRWGIDSSRLPAGSEIRFKQPTMWETYREYVVAAVAVIAAQLVLIGGLLAERARRRKAERTIRAREATLRESYERTRLLAGRLLNAQEETRSDIARDLHDDVCQKLVGVAMTVTGLKRSGNIRDVDAERELSDLQQQALDLVDGVRRMSHDLHPAGLRLVGLAGALQGHCIEVERRHDVQVAFNSEGDLREIRPDVALCLFRTAQEALRNGATHGDARRLSVSIVRADPDVQLTITDDGKGFDVDAVRRGGFGLGLVSMEERAHLLGGTVSIVSIPGQGTTIRFRVPAVADRRRDDYIPAASPSVLTSASMEHL
jgi:signal transduction histidine kinase